MKPLLLRALDHEHLERPPVWLMRQAGRYMAEYRALKEKHGFLGLCKSPELALEVTMQPIEFLEPDAAILFADIMLPLECLGLEVAFNPGPKVSSPVRTRSDVEALQHSDPHHTVAYVFDAISAIKAELCKRYVGDEAKALFGFAGAPWTMACYLLDQGPFKHFSGTHIFAAQQPEAFHILMEKLTVLTEEYLLGQIEAGADAVQLFDTWAGNLNLEDYRRLALPYTQRIFERIKQTSCPCALYVNGSSHLLPGMLEAGANMISIDWRTPLSQAQELAGDTVAVQGNFDPCRLFAEKSDVIAGAKAMLQSASKQQGYIVNLGHGILPTTPPENVRAFVDTIKEGWS